MSAYQKKHNRCMSLFARFQTRWRGEVTASEAFIKAKEDKLEALRHDINAIESLSFSDMRAHGVVARGVTEDCKR